MLREFNDKYKCGLTFAKTRLQFQKPLVHIMALNSFLQLSLHKVANSLKNKFISLPQVISILSMYVFVTRFWELTINLLRLIVTRDSDA